MPKAKKEFILNYSMNRWQLNFKRNVGATSDSIRLCSPTSYNEWENIITIMCVHEPKLMHLEKHIRVDLPEEERLVASITKQDCIAYMNNVIIDRVYNGYIKEHERL